METAKSSERDVDFDPQEVATPSNIAWAERDRKAERDALLQLLSEYTARVDDLTKAIDQLRQRNALTLMWMPSALVLIFFGLVWLFALFPLSDFLNLAAAVTGIGLLLAFVPTLRIYIEQKRRIRLLERDLKIAARQLERILQVATSVEQNALARSIERLEFNLRLTDAEEKLRYIGSIS